LNFIELHTCCIQILFEVTEEKDKQAELSVEWDRGIERQVRILASDRIQVQRIIDCALPDLNEARESLKTISKSDLESIRLKLF
jgi:hypothetical protein